MHLNTLPDIEIPGNRSKPSWFMAFLRRLNGLVLYTVILPTLLAIIYFGFVASDIYISESRLVMRSPRHQAPSGLGSLLQGVGISRAQDDTFTVHDFILSRDALRKLNAQFGIDKSYGDGRVDFINRFAGLDGWNKNFEGLYRYYKNRVVTVETDSISSILTLTVRAFSAEEAYRINEKLVEMSEELVNQLNGRIRQDLIDFALVDVDIAQKKAEAAVLAVAKYRNLKSVFDPEKQSPLNLTLIEKLEGDLIAVKAQLAQISALTPDNPQIPSLKRQVGTLQAAIDSEMTKVAGGSQSLSNKAAEYERLAFGREFAVKQLAEAMGSLEGARNEARRKQVYLERLVQPGKPDVAVEPKRLRNVFAVFAVGMVTWGVLALLLIGTREHKNF